MLRPVQIEIGYKFKFVFNFKIPLMYVPRFSSDKRPAREMCVNIVKTFVSIPVETGISSLVKKTRHFQGNYKPLGVGGGGP